MHTVLYYTEVAFYLLVKTRLNPLYLCVCAGYLCRSKETAFFGDVAPAASLFYYGGMMMSFYKDLYYKLYAVMADAVESLEHDEPIAAKKTLIAAMKEAEEIVISAEGDM